MNNKIHIFIATPAYDGKVNIPYAISLAETISLLRMHGIEVTTRVTASGSLLVAERNRLIQQFWDSNATHMLCIDSDLGWPAQAVLAMLEANKEFIAGIYPARGDSNSFIFRPVKNKDETIVQDKHLLKMHYIPAGFMLLKRSVIEKMRKKHKKLYYEPKDPRNNPEPGYCFFNTEVWEGEFWGEDFIFCRNVRQAGIDIWVDPLIQFDHAGTIGMLVQALTPNKNEAAIIPPIARNKNYIISK